MSRIEKALAKSVAGRKFSKKGVLYREESPNSRIISKQILIDPSKVSKERTFLLLLSFVNKAIAEPIGGRVVFPKAGTTCNSIISGSIAYKSPPWLLCLQFLNAQEFISLHKNQSSTLANNEIEIYDVTGAYGAARAASYDNDISKIKRD